MDHEERSRKNKTSNMRLGFFIAFVFAAWYGLLSVGHMSRFSELATPYATGWKHVEGIVHSSAKFEKTTRDQLADEFSQALRGNKSLIHLADKALDIVVGRCDYIYQDYLCEEMIEEPHCTTRKMVDGNCIRWKNLRKSNVTIDYYSSMVLLEDVYGLETNGTHVISTAEPRFGSAHYSLKQMELIEAMQEEFAKIQRHAILLANMMKNITAIGVYTKSFDDFVSLHSGGFMRASCFFYVSMGFVGAPIPFVGYYIFSVIYDYYDFSPSREVVTVEGVTTMRNIFGEEAWAAMFRIFYIDLWGNVALEIVVFIMCYYMEYFCPLFYILSKFGKKLDSWMENHWDIYETFSAFPAFLLGFLSAFRYLCIGIIVVSVALRVFVLSIVATITIAKVLLAFGAIGLGVIGTLMIFIRSRSTSLTFLFGAAVYVAEAYAGTEIRELAGLIPSDMGEFSLANWFIMVPKIVIGVFSSMPSGVFAGIVGLMSFTATDIVKQAASSVVSMNPAMEQYRNTEIKLHGLFRLACAIENTFSWVIFLVRGVFWFITISSPFIRHIGFVKVLFGGIFASEGWLFQAAKIFAVYLSQRA